jgi:glycine dehydrogenase
MVHQHGGRVYVDGANMNALVGVAAPGEFGGDVSHLNLHKTFCIPHGGGGPASAPSAWWKTWCPSCPAMPRRPGARWAPSAPRPGQCRRAADQLDVHPHDGHAGLTAATETAILNANYMAPASDHYDPRCTPARTATWPTSASWTCARSRTASGVSAEDVAKRLIDYGFHAPR